MKTFAQFIFEITKIPTDHGERVVSIIHHPTGVYSYPKYAHHYKVNADNGLEGHRYDGTRHEGYATMRPHGKIEMRYYGGSSVPDHVKKDIEDHMKSKYILPKKHEFIHKSAFEA